MNSIESELNDIESSLNKIQESVLIVNEKMDKNFEELYSLGKYGEMARKHLKENFPERYNELSKKEINVMFRKVDDECYERLDIIMEQYLKKNPLTNPSDTMQSYREREQAKNIAEEIIFKEIVYQIR